MLPARTVKGGGKKKGKKAAMERMFREDGTRNLKYVDLLGEDKPIAGQHYFCASFVSPETIIKQREMFFFEEFVKRWDFNQSMAKFIQFLNFLSFQRNMTPEETEKLMGDFKEFVTEEKSKLMEMSVEDEYKTFVEQNEEKLMEKFNREHEFQTSVRGFKFRGAFPTEEEANKHADLLRDTDPAFSVHVGPVGLWIPFDPEDKVKNVIYKEEELNQLMHDKAANDAKAKLHFEQRVQEAKRKAIEENIAKAQKTGAKLTQTLDDKGNLVGVGMQSANTDTNSLFAPDDPEYILQKKAEAEDAPVSAEDVRKVLFEGDVVMPGEKA